MLVYVFSVVKRILVTVEVVKTAC